MAFPETLPTDQAFELMCWRKLQTFLSADEKIKKQLASYLSKETEYLNIHLNLENAVNTFKRPIDILDNLDISQWQKLILTALAFGAVAEVDFEIKSKIQSSSDIFDRWGMQYLSRSSTDNFLQNNSKEIIVLLSEKRVLSSSFLSFKNLGDYSVEEIFKNAVDTIINEEFSVDGEKSSELCQSSQQNNNQMVVVNKNSLGASILLTQAGKDQKSFLGFSVFVIALFTCFFSLANNLVSAGNRQLFHLFSPRRVEEEYELQPVSTQKQTN